MRVVASREVAVAFLPRPLFCVSNNQHHIITNIMPHQKRVTSSRETGALVRDPTMLDSVIPADEVTESKHNELARLLEPHRGERHVIVLQSFLTRTRSPAHSRTR
jgi:hypothetical protein